MDEFRSKHLIVRYDAGVCTHAGECVRGLPVVFDANRTPWIDLTRGDSQAVIETIRKCPSGALTFELVDAAVRT